MLLRALTSSCFFGHFDSVSWFVSVKTFVCQCVGLTNKFPCSKHVEFVVMTDVDTVAIV